MVDCCCAAAKQREEGGAVRCPKCGEKGKPVEIITLKSLLLPGSLARLDPKSSYSMCVNKVCDVVYFSEAGGFFSVPDLKVPVFQKSDATDCPVCYCFGLTRAGIRREIEETGQSTAIATITAHIAQDRCGCQVNNPQGSCCLANVKQVLRSYQD